MESSSKSFSLCLVLLSSLLGAAYCTRPNYLTHEDFARAGVAPYVALNDSVFNLPRNDVEIPLEKNVRRSGLWPNARIPYTLDPKFNDQQRAEIARAFNNYQWYTCVRFVERGSGDADYVEILRDDSICGGAHICKIGGAQFAKFGGSCINSGVMTHELGHTLCFDHEQSRPDRDNWIDWDTSKCKVQDKDNANDFTTLDLLYDYVSLQHYEGECYNGCIKPKVPGVTKCGSGGVLSVLDIEKVNAAYNCGGCASYRFRPLSDKNANWVLAGNDLGGDKLYPCRTYYNGDIISGKTNGNGCWVSYKGGEYRVYNNVEVLTNPQNVNLRWVRRDEDGSIPWNVIRGGRTAERETMFIGRCTLTDSDGRKTTIPGKRQASLGKELLVPFGGYERKCEDFEYLVCG